MRRSIVRAHRGHLRTYAVLSYEDLYSYEDAQNIAHHFEDLLKNQGILIQPGSDLEALTLSVFEIAYGRQPSALAYSVDLRKLFRHLVGLTDLAALVLRVRDHPDFTQLLPHLELLNAGNGIQSDVAASRNSASDKLFELFVGCLAMRCGSAVMLDNPQHSDGSNPDVLATIQGRRWGFACKALRSLSPESVIENLRKAIDQIERSPAEVGVPIFSLRSVLNHDEHWGIVNLEDWEAGAEPIYNCFPTPAEPIERLKQDVQQIGKLILDRAGRDAIVELFNGKKAAPAFLQWAHVASCIVVQDRPIPFSNRFFNLAVDSSTDPRGYGGLRLSK